MGLTLCPLGRLHDVLMALQRQQLQQLSAWLALTEERIQKMEARPLDDDLKSLQKLLEEHKVTPAPISFMHYQAKQSSTLHPQGLMAFLISCTRDTSPMFSLLNRSLVRVLGDVTCWVREEHRLEVYTGLRSIVMNVYVSWDLGRGFGTLLC